MTFVKFMEWEFSERERNSSATRAPRYGIVRLRLFVFRPHRWRGCCLAFALLRTVRWRRATFGSFARLLKAYEAEEYLSLLGLASTVTAVV